MNWSIGITAVAAAALASGPLVEQSGSPQFAAAVSLVAADVVVTDTNGDFVSDLQARDFALYEDGERQSIVDVQLVDLSRGTVRRRTGSSPLNPASPGADIINGVPASDLGAVIFFIEFPGLYFQNKLRLADSLIAMLRRIEELRVPHAVYFVDLAGPLRELAPLTSDLAVLGEAALRLRAIPLTQTRDDIFEFLESDEGGKTQWSQAQQRNRALHTYGLLKDFVEYLAARSGRTALVWVSTGVDLGDYGTVARVQGRDSADRFRFYSSDEKREQLQGELHRAANASNVSIYSLDPSALHEFYGLPTSVRAGTVADARGNSLRDAANETGGQAFVAWTDLNLALDRIENDTRQFYLLSFAPGHDSADGEYHRIRVEVGRPDVQVRARRGYVHYSETDRVSRSIRGALELPGVASGLEVAVEGIRARDSKGQALLVVATAVASESGRRREAMGSDEPSAPLLLYATARDEHGKLVAQAQHTLGHAAEPRDAKTPAQPIASHQLTWELPHGRYTVRVAIFDPGTGKLGAAGLDVHIADEADEWHTSDPALLAGGGIGERATVIGGALANDQDTVVYVEVYNGVAPALSATISNLGEVNVDGSPRRGLGRVQLPHDAGIHRGTLPLPALDPGDYLLEIIVEDPEAGERRSTSLRVRAFDGN